MVRESGGSELEMFRCNKRTEIEELQVRETRLAKIQFALQMRGPSWIEEKAAYLRFPGLATFLPASNPLPKSNDNEQ